MTRTRWFGFGLWALCAVLTAVTFGIGWAAMNGQMDRAQGLALAVAFGIAAEASFWSGGALLGFSFFAKRGGWVRRLLKREKPEGVQ